MRTRPMTLPQVVFLALLAFPGCQPRGNPTNSPQGAALRGLDLQGMDPKIRPGDNFFAYANGRWLATQEIPLDRSSYGIHELLAELTLKRTVDLIKDAANTTAPKGSDEQKIGDFYASILDEETLEKKGLSPLEEPLKKIAAISNTSELSAALGARLRADVDVLNNTHLVTNNLFGLWVAQDLDDPTRYSPFLLQGGLGMPDRDYYLDPSPRMVALRKSYTAYVAKMLQLAKIPSAQAMAERIFDLEQRIAKVHAPREDTEDVKKGNNHFPRAEFDRRAPGIKWQAFFAAAELGNQKEFVVWQVGALIGISALVSSQPLAAWKDYLTFRTIEEAVRALPKGFVQESFAFYGQELAGTPKLPERWKIAMRSTDAALGEAVGRLYVARYFPASEKARAEEMVKNELEAFAKRIDQLSWMSPATKEHAKAKLKALKVYVGYPDKWRDYSDLEVRPDDAYGNLVRASLFEYRRNLRKLGQPVDRGEWVMNPQLVNAVNLPAMNALNFPAAMLQPPLFDPNRPVAMDYGAIGATIGHEISHSFDTQGALFDETGKLSNWWTEADFAHFKKSAEKLVLQYNGYRPFPDLPLNGKLTVGENIADVAGLAVAYDAHRLSLAGKEAQVVDGFSSDQQFFISFAQSWRTKIREKSLRQQVLLDGHAPAEYRADTVRNLDPFYDAFGVKKGEALFLEKQDRVRIW